MGSLFVLRYYDLWGARNLVRETGMLVVFIEFPQWRFGPNRGAGSTLHEHLPLAIPVFSGASTREHEFLNCARTTPSRVLHAILDFFSFLLCTNFVDCKKGR